MHAWSSSMKMAFVHVLHESITQIKGAAQAKFAS